MLTNLISDPTRGEHYAKGWDYRPFPGCRTLRLTPWSHCKRATVRFKCDGAGETSAVSGPQQVCSPEAAAIIIVAVIVTLFLPPLL